MIDCIFCKIIAGEIPCTKVYEDDKTFAFLDIAPNSAGHTLVVPKQHCTNLLDADEETLQATMQTVQKIAQALSKYSEGVNLVQNNNEAAGQIVFHLHFHVVPRTKGDNIMFVINERRDPYKDGEAEKVAEEIKNLL